MYGNHKKEISKENYEAIKAGEKSVYDFFSEAAVIGYGCVAFEPFEKEGKFYIPYNMSNSCD